MGCGCRTADTNLGFYTTAGWTMDRKRSVTWGYVQVFGEDALL